MPTHLEKDLKRDVDGEIRFDEGTRALYSTDSSNYRYLPFGVVIPKTLEAVEKTVAVCHRHGIAIVSRGCGTSLCGQTCNEGIVIDFSKHLNRILEMDPKARTALVEPGLILDDLRDEAQNQYHLTFGPDPATHKYCTLGGMIGNNSCGVHAQMAGSTANNVIAMEVLTYDGLKMWVGETEEGETDLIIREGGRKGEIYKAIRNLRDKYGRLVEERYPKIPRRISGYNLDELGQQGQGMNLAKALVGTESTCVTVLQAKLRLVPSPPARSLLVLGFPDVYIAGDHVPEINRFNPLALEGLDDLLVHFMKIKGIHTGNLSLLPEGKGWLMVEFGGANKKESDDAAKKCMEALKRWQKPPSMKLYDDKVEEALVWEIRESGLGATANVPTLPLTWPGWEDAAVPVDKLGNYLRDFRKLLDAHGLLASLYGHFGQACVHCRISFDFLSKEGVARYMAFIDKASDLIVSYGGSFTAEHGDGQSKAIFLPKLFGRELASAFAEFKKIWDPQRKMNPGKIADPYRPDQHLRLGSNYRPWSPETHYRFPEDKGNFPRATLRCVGVGKCRRVHNVFMCPSFLATRDEKDTTRGRARALFEMLRDQSRGEWRNRGAKEALELCLGCKGCKKECPINVDMAVYKSEFLSHYYRFGIRPLSFYAMGFIRLWAILGSGIAPIANFLARAPVSSTFLKFVAGISQKRSLPPFASETFREWVHRNRPRFKGSRVRKVVLFVDAFNNYFFPETLVAAFQILNSWEYEVLIPAGRQICIRPLLHFGFLPSAKREIREAIRQLSPYASEGLKIVFLEPSSASVFRDELHALFPGDIEMGRITEKCLMLSEFIVQEKLKVPSLSGKAFFHGHCHQKASLNVQTAIQVLKDMGLEVEEPQKGCCGMAGSFGFEKKHYEISQKIGEKFLFPAIRKKAPDHYVIADGFSCRKQILDGTGRQPLHLAELILNAMEKEKAESNQAKERIRKIG